ncbi:hypothetical protein FNF27_07219 [Cafeteria roenbergensis]|uniref:Uncharacterized protein n=1 Tax=Cafeteria roenbergensis TaxID=33653 RepID=A0A5A8DB35_CAFRO|nr:hypothetical protein FNF29_01897 [Cafeteria roenbergensis]KAA0161817.1 hypothetical protein FNF31_03602 [Cafeteria roenbergensis]KAA0166384.1 hypothetical protein FNF28_03153 [Cafeteria roenbergensis]KAA0167972.1 hypothetical protein FNF27_07219 [Cafeteria roenbergensis]|eukprot:KAA0155146.1 hypothetical protein FNF29_01897 [Cafeteria roenbergensis]
MPVRVTITAGASDGMTDETTAPRVVYTWRHPQFAVTCAALQNEEIALGAKATLPLFFESQTVRAVSCARGERASNETVVRVQVTRYPGMFVAACTIILLILSAALVGSIFTCLCLPDGMAFSIPGFLAATFPTFTVAFTGTALFDFLTLGGTEPAFVIVGVLAFFVLINAATSAVFFRRDLPYQRSTDYRFRRWTDKHQFEHSLLGCCATVCGVGCVKLIYSRFMRLWPFSPDFKRPPGFAPSDVGAGGVQGEVAAAAGGGAAGREGATAGGAELDASANPTQSNHLESAIPPHADWRLDLFQALTLPFLHIPLLVLGLVLELRVGGLDWVLPQCVIGLIAFHAAGLLVFLFILYRVCTVPSRERLAQRRRFHAVQEGRSTLGSSMRDSGDSDRDSEHSRLSRDLRSQRGKRGKRGATERDLDRVNPDELEDYRRRAPGQPRLLFVQADKDARKELAKRGTRDIDATLPGEKSPRMGMGGRNAVLTERKMKQEERKRREEERRQRRLRGLPSLDGASVTESPREEDEEERAMRLQRERAAAARAKAERAKQRWIRATGVKGYGEPEPQQAEAAEAFNMRLQTKIDEANKAKAGGRRGGGVMEAMARAAGRPAPVAVAEPDVVDDSLEVEVVRGEEVQLPGGGLLRGAPKRRVVAQPAVEVGKGAKRRTIRVAPDSPRALEAAARQQVDFDDAVKSNPFHPLHNAPSAAGGPEGASKVREALRVGRKEGEALAIPAAGAGRRRSVVIPVAGKLRTDGQAATAVLASSGAVSKAAAAAGPRQGSNTGEAIGRSVAAQTLALRQLADKGRDDLVPNARRRMSDEDSFDDDL